MIAASLAVIGLVAVVVAVRYAGRSESSLTLRLTFPRTVTAERAVAAARVLAGLLPPWRRRVLGSPFVSLEVRASTSGIEHVLSLPASRAEYVIGALRAALPGLRIEEEVPNGPSAGFTRELRRSGAGALRTDAATDTNAGILAALQPLGEDERAVVQYVITPDAPGPVRRTVRWLATQWDDSPAPPPASVEPTFAVAVRVGVSAPAQPRATQLMARLLGSFHALNTPEARLIRRLIPSSLTAARLRRGDPGSVALAADELAALWGVPLDAPALPGLTLARSRELPVVSAVPRQGFVLGDSTVADATRPVAVSFGELRRGLHICAPTGGGKSTALINCASQIMRAEKRPGLLIFDTKGDLVADVADRIPDGRDVLIFDPADAAAPVGFNLIGGSGDAGLIVDHVVTDLRARYGAAGLGPRSEDLLRASLTTLTSQPDRYTLCEVEPLLTNAAFRRKLVGRLDDPVLQSFWAWYGSLSDAQRTEVIAPLSNKLRSFTLRRRVRAVIGQTDGLDLAEALDGKITLISLAKGTVGADAAALIGAAMISRLWTAIQARASESLAERRPAVVICDEFQDFAAISSVFADAVAQSRGYGVAWVLSHQHLAQLDRDTRQAVLANCRSRLVLQTTAADADAFSREFAPYLDAPDLQGLGPFEGYAAISTGASVAAPASIRTRPAPASLHTAERVRARSRAAHGVAAADVDKAIRARVGQARPPAPVGAIRRAS